ncbi:TPA: HlyD family efflux transporter periplasmic adaptor subunit [Legionella pneumophila]|nr:HlyD family efflux transporter periplasmic adaptor subunit [Legionella pneumophila]MDW8878732.1 HlyD family efflux transporter periplasmic adaptor subunit [Legionella pneumophila subsp. fraseri]HAT1846239.1 HlyD family efflux transporter periplasmic adaptor subunit [Legionella pneumophila]HAT1861222.1 HlyD family efflux transporter periplasmic adaptor subunit [Legionella pneumophila]HAT3976899.1 HlyD family efflux transporter periplasmic adaptor subunit [Legionella pneumophila]HAT7796718.1 
MKKDQLLFREEAVNSRVNRNMGTIRINVPFSYWVASGFSLLLLMIIFLFLFYAQVAEKIVVRGYLDSENGIVTVQSKSDGVILQSNAIEGKKVKKGDVLFIITAREKEKIKALIDNLEQRKKNLNREYQLKQDHYQALFKLYEKHYISSSVLKDTEALTLEISNQIKSIDLELIKYRHSQHHLIKAPINGTLTNILYKQGQIVEPSHTLFQIIPDHSKLVARLCISSQDMGFLKKDTPVSIKYDAYPTQKFGAYKALIKEINLTVLTDDKEDKPIKIGQPYYKAKAELEQQYINSYGNKVNLSHGMTITAVITGNKKKIWKWILDPIYSYYGEYNS